MTHTETHLFQGNSQIYSTSQYTIIFNSIYNTMTISSLQQQYTILAKKIQQETGFSEEVSRDTAVSIINTDNGSSPTYTLEDIYKDILKIQKNVQYA